MFLAMLLPKTFLNVTGAILKVCMHLDLHSMIFFLVYFPLVVTRLQEGSGYLKTVKVEAPRARVLHCCA